MGELKMKIREFRNFLNSLDEKVLDYDVYLADIYKCNVESWESTLIDSNILEDTSETIEKERGLYLVVDRIELGNDDVCIVPQNYEIREMEEN